MPAESAQVAQHTGSAKLEMNSPLASRALFWKSRYLRESEFLHHMPIAFWLADICRPTTVVELGLSDGQSYFGFCQALERLNLAARCYGFLEAQVELADADTVNDILTHNAANYDEFSTIETQAADKALRGFDKGTVDLLIVNMALPEETLAVLSDDWDRRLSERGVILLRNHLGDHKVDGGLISRIRGSHETITFDRGGGLTVVLHGAKQEERLRHLGALRFGSQEYNTVRAVFGRLGSSHYFEWASRKFEQDAAEARKLAARARKALDSRTWELEELQATHELQSAKLAQLQVGLFDLQQDRVDEAVAKAEEIVALTAARDEARDEAVAKAEEIVALTAARDEARDEAVAALRDEVDRARAEAAQARAELEARSAELAGEHARLTALVAEQREEAERRQALHVEETVALTRLCEEAAQAAAGSAASLEAVQAETERARVQLRLRDMLIEKLDSRRWRLPGATTMDGAVREQVRLVSESPLFNAKWYLEAYPDVRASGMDPARHFVAYGLYEGRRPSSDFDIVVYYVEHPETLEAGLNPVVVAGRNAASN